MVWSGRVPRNRGRRRALTDHEATMRRIESRPATDTVAGPERTDPAQPGDARAWRAADPAARSQRGTSAHREELAAVRRRAGARRTRPHRLPGTGRGRLGAASGGDAGPEPAQGQLRRRPGGHGAVRRDRTDRRAPRRCPPPARRHGPGQCRGGLRLLGALDRHERHRHRARRAPPGARPRPGALQRAAGKPDVCGNSDHRALHRSDARLVLAGVLDARRPPADDGDGR